MVGFHSFFFSPGAYETDLIAPSSSPEKKCGMARSGVVEGEPDANLEIATQLIGLLPAGRAGGALRVSFPRRPGSASHGLFHLDRPPWTPR